MEPLVALTTGCDSSAEAEEPPVPLAPPQEASVVPVVQVRRYSWQAYDKHVAYDKRREFVGRNKQINTNSPLLSQQEPLVARVHLMKVVRKIGQQERARGKNWTVDKFKEQFSSGGKDVTSSSHPNKSVDEGNVTRNNVVHLGISKGSYKYPEIGDRYNAESTGKQEREGMNETQLLGTPVCKSAVTSLMDDVTVREQDGERSLDALVARRCENVRSQLGLFAEQGRRKVVTGYNKVITIMTVYWLLIMQVLKGITSSRRCEGKSVVGNSARLPSSTSVQDYDSYAFYSVLECLGDLLRYRLMFMLFLIICGLFEQYELIKDENKEIWCFRNTLTFRLVAVKLGYVTYYSATFLETFGLRSGSIMKTFMEGKCFEICLSPFSDLCASCHDQLRSLLINLEFGKRFKVNYEHINLYIYRVCHCMSSCKWASFPLDFAVKSYTLVYFSSKASLLMRKSYKKNQSIDLIGLALVEKAYA